MSTRRIMEFALSSISPAPGFRRFPVSLSGSSSLLSLLSSSPCRVLSFCGSYYMHCSKLLVKKGDKVLQGTVIGLVGSTGISTGIGINPAVPRQRPDHFIRIGFVSLHNTTFP